MRPVYKYFGNTLFLNDTHCDNFKTYNIGRIPLATFDK